MSSYVELIIYYLLCLDLISIAIFVLKNLYWNPNSFKSKINNIIYPNIISYIDEKHNT